MAKKTLASTIEEYKAPWEIDKDGNDIPSDDQQLDPTALKRYLYGLLGDKDRLQTTVATVTGERDKLQTDLTAEIKKHEGDEERKERERQEAIQAAEAKGGTRALALEVALDVEGITVAQAKALAPTLTGQTRDELTASATALVEAFGLVKPEGDGGEQEPEAEEPTVSRKPRVVRAAGDPKPDARALPDPKDPEAMAKAFPR